MGLRCGEKIFVLELWVERGTRWEGGRWDLWEVQGDGGRMIRMEVVEGWEGAFGDGGLRVLLVGAPSGGHLLGF